MYFSSQFYGSLLTAREFRKAYQQAVDAGDDQFTFEGHEVLVSYAKYMCEYLTTQGLLDKDDLSSRGTP